MSSDKNRLTHTSGYWLHHFEGGWKRLPIGIREIRIVHLYWTGGDAAGVTQLYPAYNHDTNQHLSFVGFRTHDVQWRFDDMSKVLTLTTTIEPAQTDVHMSMPHEVGDLCESPNYFISLHFCSRPMTARL